MTSAYIMHVSINAMAECVLKIDNIDGVLLASRIRGKRRR